MNTLMKQTLQILETRSQKALESAKQQLLLTQIENKALRQALAYYADNWDDTLHPGMISIASEAVGGNMDDSLSMQVSMLFLTAAVDVHDDIIDGSKTKNGKLTVLGKFGKDLALLVGDGLLLKGMTLLYKNTKSLPPKTINSIVEAIDATFTEAGDAHTQETSYKRKLEIDPEEYFQIIKKKASILEAHTRIGALVGKGTEKQVKILGEFGRALGTLILLRDEFIDLFESQELSDRIKNGCLPLPIIYAFQNPSVKKKMMTILSKPRISRKDTELIVELISGDKKVELLKSKMKNLAKRTLQVVSDLPQSKNLELLIAASLENI
jgi:geranylgeranyl pyrophosphate synthase